ncbi:hypothetical protein Rsub_12635 [Raphidocelis subcapitata]|uniref:Protein transport protein SEC23 n=1 Tax=Raphidocelis subcapitata TaxID=307507 RepID=A0A2V0PLK8_9CHLO|nr:hypothetical protein Rsub_12635 [Raphidocelis subcapitata]|eukprot:GBF99942.1 hypothetical protein Rsub_12635 [Raphidocelis subcapitata]
MRPDEPLVPSCAVLVNNRAFVNSNGWPFGLLVSPQPPQSLPTPPAGGAPPPAWLALVIDAGMHEEALAAAAAGVSQALGQLPQHTHVLLAVADRAASFFDLASPRPQSWVLAGPGPPPPPDATARLLRASGVRPVPLRDCAASAAAALRALRPAGGGGGGGGGAPGGGGGDDEDGRGEERSRLRVLAAAVDLSLHLLGRGMADWDARHKAELAALGSPPASPGRAAHPFPHKPMHAARVLVLTASGARARPQLPPQDARRAAAVRALFDEVGAKAAALDAQVDAAVGDTAAPALPLLLAAADACGGAVHHQPGLAAPLASNLVALAGRRLGWDAFVDVRVPAGVRVRALVGPGLQPGAPLPASISPVDPQPLLNAQQQQQQQGGQQQGGQQQQQQQQGGHADGGGGGGGAPSPQQQQQRGQPRSPSPRRARVERPAVAPTRLSAAAAGASAIDRGRFYGAALELTGDPQPGVAQEVQVLWEWTTADGRRVRQVSSTQLAVAERLPDFLSGLDLEAGALLLCRRLVGSALAQATPWGRPLKRGALADARTSAGLALQLIAQRMGAARHARRGILGFGGPSEWELPPALVPLAVALYLLQAGPLLTADDGADGAADAAAADAWRLRAHQFLAAAPAAAACVAAPALYVRARDGGFEAVPPVTLAVEPGSLAVLDCGHELLVYAGAALLGAADAAADADADGGGPNGAPPPGGRQAQAQAGPSPQPPDDLPAASAPAVQYSTQLARGRLPVPSIQVIQDAAGVALFLGRLLPLHADVPALALALLPALRELRPSEHGALAQWHAAWRPRAEDGGFGHFCAAAGVSLPVEGGLMEVVEAE